jgi:hypothetical protein
LLAVEKRALPRLPHPSRIRGCKALEQHLAETES